MEWIAYLVCLDREQMVPLPFLPFDLFHQYLGFAHIPSIHHRYPQEFHCSCCCPLRCGYCHSRRLKMYSNAIQWWNINYIISTINDMEGMLTLFALFWSQWLLCNTILHYLALMQYQISSDGMTALIEKLGSLESIQMLMTREAYNKVKMTLNQPWFGHRYNSWTSNDVVLYVVAFCQPDEDD